MRGQSIIHDIDYDPVSRQLMSVICVSDPAMLRRLRVQAVWDTGAGISLIAKSIADRLALRADFDFGISGAFASSTARLVTAWALLCIGGTSIPLIAGIVDDDKIPGGWYKVVLGMPFIERGDFHIYHGKDKHLKAKFVYPPLPEIDIERIARSIGRDPATQSITQDDTNNENK